MKRKEKEKSNKKKNKKQERLRNCLDWGVD